MSLIGLYRQERPDEEISLGVRRGRCSEVTRLLLLLLLDCCWYQHYLRRYGRLLSEKRKARSAAGAIGPCKYITCQRETTAMNCIELQGRCLCVVAVYMRQGSILLFSFLVRSNLDGNLLVGRFLLSRSLELASTGSLFAQLADDNPLCGTNRYYISLCNCYRLSTVSRRYGLSTIQTNHQKEWHDDNRS